MRLNIVTRDWHAAVDEPWLQLLRPDVGRADYLGQLVRTYGFVAPFEAACRYTPSLDRALQVPRMARAGLIAQDLLQLRLTPSQVSTVPQCSSIAIFRSIPEALGWMYVIERATLLQDGIRRHLLNHVPEVQDACSYLAAFDGRVGEHWNAFGRALDRVGSTNETADEIIAAADAGFACVHAWFSSNQGKVRVA